MMIVVEALGGGDLHIELRGDPLTMRLLEALFRGAPTSPMNPPRLRGESQSRIAVASTSTSTSGSKR